MSLDRAVEAFRAAATAFAQGNPDPVKSVYFSGDGPKPVERSDTPITLSRWADDLASRHYALVASPPKQFIVALVMYTVGSGIGLIFEVGRTSSSRSKSVSALPDPRL